MLNYHVHHFASDAGASHLLAAGGAVLRDGFPYLSSDHDLAVLEAPLAFLRHKHGDPRSLGDGTWSADSANATAYDLRFVFDGAHRAEIGPLELDGDFLDDFAVSARQVPNKRNRLNSREYVNRQVATAHEFSHFAYDRGYRDDDPGEIAQIALSALPKMGARPSNNVISRPPRAMFPSELKRLIPHLGPLPSAWTVDGPTSRTRLGTLFSTGLGCRADEVVNVLVDRIEDMRPAVEADPGGSSPLLLDKTKGLVERTVPCPHWLASEALAYSDGERAHVVSIAEARYWRGADGAPRPVSLLVNGADAKANVGGALSRQTLELDFHRAVLAANLTRPDRQLDAAGRPTLVRVAAFSFHAGRHTHAVQLWIRRKMGGDRYPEHVVQARLGHADPQITRRRYLATIGMFETSIGDGLEAFFRMLNHA